MQGRTAKRKIFIRNLPPNCNAAELRDAFNQFGIIEDSAVVVDPRGKSRGFGFITYVSQEGAVKAAAEPQQTFSGRVVFVSIAKSCAATAKPTSPAIPRPSNILFDPWTDDQPLPSPEILLNWLTQHSLGGNFIDL